VTPLESRMDIANSEIQYLGWNDAESYGLVWKVNGFTGSNLELFDQVQVRGNIVNSHIHHNYYGVYTFGHQDGVWTGNELDHNAGYGFDPHDDTDNLLIENNDVHDNGNHGIIASKRCDHVIVRNNRTYNNTGNGIMLHRSSNDGLVEDNQSHDNSDSGVAIFATARSVIRNNTLLNNANAGIRLSLGASDSVVTGNDIGFSEKGFYFYKGSDAPEPGDDGRPKRNLFQANTVHDISSTGIKMTDGDANRFVNNTFSNVGTQFLFTNSTASEITGAIPNTIVVTLSGAPGLPSDITLRPLSSVRVALQDQYSTARLRDGTRAVFDTTLPLFTAITSSSSLLTLTQALIGSGTQVFKRNFRATPTGTNVYIQPTSWGTNRAWQARINVGTGSVQYVMGDLVPGAQYLAKQGSTTLGTFAANGSGQVTFSVSPGTSSTLTYTLTQQ
jgi:parallel beta-helix repeat protein